MKNGIDEKWVRKIYKSDAAERDCYTFCGALEHLYDKIAWNWSSKTRTEYNRMYNNIILPALKDHDDKTIREYTSDDYLNAVEKIRERGYESNGTRKRYTEASIGKYEYLIYLVVNYAFVHGLCDNVLWGSKFMLESLEKKDIKEEYAVIKKSLSILQEKKFFAITTRNIYVDGAVVALLLMWALGLRNAEACGLNYGDIKPLEGHEGVMVAWIYKTTKIGSSELQSGGKTYNTGRIIPVPGKIVEFLAKRKARIIDIMKAQGLDHVDIDAIPICCDGIVEEGSQCYLRRIKADQVTVMARKVFEEAGISAIQVAYADKELSEGNVAKILKEKEPTAYLLRRNYATQLSILGFDNAEMQYLMGHAVEDAYESRNDFVDSDRICAMSSKLSRRALLNDASDDASKIYCSGFTKIRIVSKEPQDSFRVAVIGPYSDEIEAEYYTEAAKKNCNRTVDIINDYKKLYKIDKIEQSVYDNKHKIWY